MAKVNNVGLNLNQKVANPFKTSRNSTTNPFKYSNFEGNTLQFADVFEGFEEKKSLSFKGKMITSSVVGSITKLRSKLPESIVKFVNRVSSGISNAWEFTTGKPLFYLPGERAVKNLLNTDIKELPKETANYLSNIGEGISSKMSDMGNGLANIGHTISEKLHKDIVIKNPIRARWDAMVSNMAHHNKITADTSVDTLKNMWIEINAAAEREAA